MLHRSHGWTPRRWGHEINSQAAIRLKAVHVPSFTVLLLFDSDRRGTPVGLAGIVVSC